MKENNHTDPILSQRKTWEESDNSVWLASTVGLYRNIEKSKFPSKLEADRQKQIVSIVSKELLTSPHLKTPKLIKGEDTTATQKEFLMEHFLSQEVFHQAHSGEAFILDSTGEFLTTINMGDHIRFQLIDYHGELENTWNRLMAIETQLGKTVAYAFSAKYGFLTADFNNCGTAMHVTVYLQVPALVHTEKVDDALERLADETIAISGIQGNPTEIIGDVIVAQNNYTLGVTEENILSTLRSFTTKMIVEENSTKSKILHGDNVEIKDKVSRAFGILIHSYQIETIEALNAISLLKLGVELGWLTGTTIKELNRLFFNCRRAHLLQHYSENIKQDELPHKRAEFIHASLKDLKLVI